MDSKADPILDLNVQEHTVLYIYIMYLLFLSICFIFAVKTLLFLKCFIFILYMCGSQRSACLRRFCIFILNAVSVAQPLKSPPNVAVLNVIFLSSLNLQVICQNNTFSICDAINPVPFLQSRRDSRGHMQKRANKQ